MTDEELDVVVADLRRQWGDRLPVPGRDETPGERDLRERCPATCSSEWCCPSWSTNG